MPSHDAMDELHQEDEEKTREEHEGEEAEEEEEEPKKEQGEEEEEKVQKPKQERDDSDEEEESEDSSGDMDEFLLVKLDEVRKEVQCPICLGIIRKTRTVMECLHRFCRECIDKSMRLGNNECPACRTHCASRRSLRDDPNYDALISALYPDIDKYEEEELSFNEEEKTRNKIIQETIAETFRRQSELLGKRATSKTNPVRRSRKRGRGSSRDAGPTGSGSEEEDQQQNNNNNNQDNILTSAPHSPDSLSPPLPPPPPPPPPPTRKRGRPRNNNNNNHPADVSAGPTEQINNNNNNNSSRGDLGNLRENLNVSPIRAWGKNGVRSRHASNNNSNGGASRVSRANRLTRLVEHLRGLDGKNQNNEAELNVVMVPLDGMERCYLSCRPSVSINHLCRVLSERTCCEVEIYAKKTSINGLNELQILSGETSLQELLSIFSLSQAHLELVYAVKIENEVGACA